MVLRSSRARLAPSFALWWLIVFSIAQTALAATIPAANFSPPRRVGYTNGDQWEPALAADGQGHIYILFPSIWSGRRLPRVRYANDLAAGQQ